MSDEDLVKRGEVKAFAQLFVHYSSDYLDGHLASAVTIEDIDSIPPASHEMTIMEFFTTIQNMCHNLSCRDCPFGPSWHPLCPFMGEGLNLRKTPRVKESDIEFVKKWAEEHSERSESDAEI